jgi:hypothetical protein
VYRIRSPSIAVLVLFNDNPFQYSAACLEGFDGPETEGIFHPHL